LGSREYPEHPLVAVSAVIHRGGKILLVRRALPPNLGSWALPGGLVEVGESLDGALHREVMEEVRIRVRLEGLLDAISSIQLDRRGRPRYHYVLLCFLARPLGTAVRLNRESSSYRWFSPEEIGRVRVTEGTSKAVKKYVGLLQSLG
jgi:8-oxo-dGTP diphosphatase